MKLNNDISINDYTYPSNSVAKGYIVDGSNTGAYQTGNEIIGLLPTYSAGS